MSKHEELLRELGLRKSEPLGADKSLKELKKLLNSYIDVMTHKLGRAPTPEEFFKAVTQPDQDEVKKSEGDEQPAGQTTSGGDILSLFDAQKKENDAMPSVFDTKVYFGVGEDKNPDPRAMLYYEHPTGGTYDIAEGRWMTGRPAVLDHLQSRPLYHDDHDLMSIVLHGLMDHHEYNSLHSAGMITPNVEKMWNLSTDLQKKWHDIDGMKSKLDEVGAKTSDQEKDIHDLLNIIEKLQDKVHDLQVELQALSPDHDFSDESPLEVDLSDHSNL